MTQALEDRYRRLLRSYPRGYRQERSAEILGTLMDLARPGQQRPTVRESAALVLAGLRNRTGAHRRHTTAAVWADALRLVVLFLLAYAGASMLAETLGVVAKLVEYQHASAAQRQTFEFWASDLGYPVTTALVAGALLAVAAGRRALALPLILLAAVAQHWAPDRGGFQFVLWQLPLAAVLAIPLLRWRMSTSPHPVRWLLALPVALVILPTQLAAVLDQSWVWALYYHQFWVIQAVLAICLLWSVVDARVPIAAGAMLLPWAVEWAVVAIIYWVIRDEPDPLLRHAVAKGALIWCGAALVPLATGAVGAARVARR